MTVEQAKKLAEEEGICYFRFVNVNGEYRFAEAESIFSFDHEALQGKDKAISAGFFRIKGESIQIGGYSMMLKLSPSEDDLLNLPKLFNLTYSPDGNFF